MARPKKSEQTAPDLTEQEINATMPNSQKIIDAQEVLKKIRLTAFNIDFMKSPEDALSSYKIICKNDDNKKDLNSKILEVWERLCFNRIAEEVIHLTGADPEQILDPKKRTPEQQQALLEASAREQERRAKIFFKSKYSHAIKVLRDIEGKYQSTYHAINDKEDFGIKDFAILYYFALHEDINPTESGSLTNEQTIELTDIFYRLDDFFAKRKIADKDISNHEFDVLYKFIELENPNTNLPVILTKKIQDIAYPLDKVNSTFWGLTPGQQATLKAESDKDSSKGNQASIYVLLNFDEMKGTGVSISRPLTSYDKRVFIASANLKEQGHDTVTTTQIYEAMGNRGRPSAQQRQKILKSIETMSLCRVTLDNSEEAAMYTKYDKVQRTFYLLPTTIEKGFINGLIVDDAITIIELPRLFVFAKNRGQFASTHVSLLESPISQTEDNLQLEDYLLTRIFRMKNAAKRNKKPGTTRILLETIYKNCDILPNERKKRSRLPEKIERLLQHYKKQGLINDYKLTAKDIDIDL